MSAVPQPDPRRAFEDLELRLEAEPPEVTGEIVFGVYAMSPRPRVLHGSAQARLHLALARRLEEGEGGAPPDWLFVIEPEIRAPRLFTRLVPDLAAWRRSTTGWPDPQATPVTLVPDWVAEILSPSTAAFDRDEKAAAYGAMGVGWMWLVDPDARRVETFENVRGRMVAVAVFSMGEAISGEPFGATTIAVAEVFTL